MEQINPLVVMVIEDQLELAELLQLILEDDGYNISICTDTRQALEQANAQKPDLVIMDINMPYLTGWQILDSFRQKPGLLHTPIIITTASSDKEAGFREKLDRYQAHFLLKPFNNSDLKNMVKDLLHIDRPA